MGTTSGSHCPGSVWCPGNVEKKAGVGSSSFLCLNLLFPITIKLAEAAEMTFGGVFQLRERPSLGILSLISEKVRLALFPKSEVDSILLFQAEKIQKHL